jgi:hypothetical protein
MSVICVPVNVSSGNGAPPVNVGVEANTFNMSFQLPGASMTVGEKHIGLDNFSAAFHF